MLRAMASLGRASEEMPRPLNEIALALAPAKKRQRLGTDTTSPWWSSRMRATVESFPIDDAKDEILKAVGSADVTVVQAETGSGKSTRVPQYLLDEHVERGARCRIAVTVHRRLAATELAKRVASERGEELCPGTQGRTSVGYWIRGESALPYVVNGIVYVTEETLVRAFDSHEFTHIIIDEAHERARAMDMLLMLWKHESAIHGRRPKLVLMTARLSMPTLRTYFAGSGGDGATLREISVPGRKFPVREVYASDVLGHHHPEDVAPEAMVRAAVDWCWGRGPGTVLVFVADAWEIDACRLKLASLERVLVCPLHGKSSVDERREALSPAPHGRKVIVATNVAETSLTIPDVKYVVDFLAERLPPSLKKQPISKASHMQRSGRAGRCGGGLCLIMSSEAFYEQLPEFRPPEAVRAPMHAWALHGLASGRIETMEACNAFFSQLPSPPDEQSVVAMAKEFEVWELTVGGRLTVIGEHVSRLPCSIEVGIALISGAFLGVGPQVAMVLAAACTDGFFREFHVHHSSVFAVDWSHQHRASDLFAAGTFLEWHLLGNVEWEGNRRVLQAVLATLDDLRAALSAFPSDLQDSSRWIEEVWPFVQFALCSGFRLNCAVHGKRCAQLQTGDELSISRHSVVLGMCHRAMFCTRKHGSFAEGVTTATALDVLVFGGQHSVPEASQAVIGGWLNLDCSKMGVEPAALIHLRQTFACLLGAYLQGSREHDLDAKRFHRMALWGTTPASCSLHRILVPLVSYEQAAQPRVCPEVGAVVSRAMEPLGRAPEELPRPAPRGTEMGEAAFAAARASCSVLPPIATLRACRLAGVHQPLGKKRRRMAEYVFFQCVLDGCLACVRRELEVVQQVSPGASSATMGYTARDFADHASLQGVEGASEVKRYLDAQWSCIPLSASVGKRTKASAVATRSGARPGGGSTSGRQPLVAGNRSSSRGSASPVPRSEPRAAMATQHVSEAFEISRQAALARCRLLPPISTLGPCRRAGAHKPRSEARRGLVEYAFLQAVSDGCLACVRHELECVQQVSPDVTSETMGYTARDFANYATQLGVQGAAEVKQYLDENWSCIAASP